MKKTWLVLLVLAGVVAAVWWRFHISSGTQDVVVYVSHDEVFSEPILKDFEKETGNKSTSRLRYGGNEKHRSNEPAHC